MQIETTSGSMPISCSDSEEFCYGQFPSTFKWGSTTSAYQTESACYIDGKGQTWWDTFWRKKRNSIADRSSGDMGADSYRRFEKDVMLLKAMNANSYKFSLSWSRICPNGTLSEINQSGLDYYDDLINTLLENGIEPIVVLYQWDFPQALVDQYPEIWQDKDIIHIFCNYARLCFKIFGFRVKRWVVMHDPWMHCVHSFGNGTHPPGIQGWNDRIPQSAYKNLLKAHSEVYRIYDEEFKSKQRGSVGISGNSKFICSKPANSNEDLSRTKNSSPWNSLLKCPADFVVLDHDFDSSEFRCGNDSTSNGDSNKNGRNIRDILNTIKDEYDNPKLVLSVSGLPLEGNQLKDLVHLQQIEYFRHIANEVLKSVVLDGCNVKGLLFGTLVDQWEYERGFTVSYGLHRVDLDHPEKPRIARSSAKYLRTLFKANGFSEDWDIGTIAY